jgi:protease IV
LSAILFSNSVEDIYDIFLEKVADGRNMTKEAVDEIGQGRVWSGENALEIGLVDELGGLDRAVKLAAELAELENYRTVDLPALTDPFQELLERWQ